MDSAVKEEQEQNQEQEEKAFGERICAYLSFPSLSLQSEWWMKFALGATSTLLVAGTVWWRRRRGE